MNRISSLLTAALLSVTTLALPTLAPSASAKTKRHTVTTTRKAKRAKVVRRTPSTGRPVARTTTTRTTTTRTANEPVVWVNTKSGIYHMPGARWHHNTQEGRYMPLSQAKAQGYRPAKNGQ